MPRQQVSFEDVTCVAQTADAICCQSPEWENDVWFPQRQVTDDSEVWQKGQTGTLVVTEWICKEKGLI